MPDAITLEQLVAELVQEVESIDADERFHYPCANVAVNAPLALVQLELEARCRLAQRFLVRAGYNGRALGVRPGPKVRAWPPSRRKVATS